MADLGTLGTEQPLGTAAVVVLSRPALATPDDWSRSAVNRGPLPLWAAPLDEALQIPVGGTIYGTLKIAGVAAPGRRLRCYHRSSGNLTLSGAISDTSGNYKFRGLTPGESYYVVAIDYPEGNTYGAVIQDNVVAEIDHLAGAAAAEAGASGTLTVA